MLSYAISINMYPSTSFKFPAPSPSKSTSWPHPILILSYYTLCLLSHYYSYLFLLLCTLKPFTSSMIFTSSLGISHSLSSQNLLLSLVPSNRASQNQPWPVSPSLSELPRFHSLLYPILSLFILLSLFPTFPFSLLRIFRLPSFSFLTSYPPLSPMPPPYHSSSLTYLS